MQLPREASAFLVLASLLGVVQAALSDSQLELESEAQLVVPAVEAEIGRYCIHCRPHGLASLPVVALLRRQIEQIVVSASAVSVSFESYASQPEAVFGRS